MKKILILKLLFYFLLFQTIAQEGSHVSLDLAKTASLTHAKQSYGSASFYKAEPFYDLNGELTVYCIIFKKNKDVDFSFSDLEKMIQNYQNEINFLIDEVNTVENLSISGKAKAKKSQILKNELYETKEKQAFKEYFITVLAGATKNHVPVIMSYQGLPKHLIQKPLITEKVNQGSTGRIFYLGMFDIYFELNSSTKSIKFNSDQIEKTTSIENLNRLINTKTYEIKSFDDLKNTKEKDIKKKNGNIRLNDEKINREEIIRKKWENIENLIKQDSVAQVSENEISRSKIESANKANISVRKYIFQQDLLGNKSSRIIQQQSHIRKKKEKEENILKTQKKTIVEENISSEVTYQSAQKVPITSDTRQSSPSQIINELIYDENIKTLNFSVPNKKKLTEKVVKDDYVIVENNLKSTTLISSSTIFYDDFSGSHPGSWYIGHNSDSGNYSWAWPGEYAHCYADPDGSKYWYPDDLSVFMERRNINLSGYNDALLSFNKIVDTEDEYDEFTVNVRDQYGTWHNIYIESGTSDPLEWEYVSLDMSDFAGQTGLHIQFRFDSDGSVSGEPYHGVYIDNVELSATSNTDPNLLPYQPSEWDDKIVVSSESGANTDGTIYQNQVSYIDLAWANNGNADAGGHVVRLYLDGSPIKYTNASDLQAGYYRYGEDWEYTFTESGWHTLKMVVDDEGDVNESNESDNEYERQIYVTPGADISNVDPTPSSPVSAIVDETFNLQVDVGIQTGAGGVLQVWVYDSNFNVSEKDWVYLSPEISTVTTLDLSWTESSTGDNSYTIYTQFRQGASSGPLNSTNTGDIIHTTENYVVSWENASSPNLLPYQPSEWDDKIVVSSESGANTDGTIYQNQVSYIDLAWANNGNADAGGHVVRLYLDGAPIKYTNASDLQAGYYRYGEDWEYTFTESGWHTLKMVVDDEGDVNESNEGDNEYERQIYVTPGADISNVDPTPSSPASAIVDETFNLQVDVGIQTGAGGVLQVWVYDSNFNISEKDWVYLSPEISTVSTIDLNWTESSTGDNSYTIYTQFRQGASSGPLNSSNTGDIIHTTENYVVSWENASSPNLLPYQPSGWDDKIVVSSEIGTNTDGTIYQNQVSYIDLAWANNGNTDAGSHVTRLYLNGTPIKYTNASGIQAGYYKYGEDWEYIFTESGWHTLKMVVDDEGDVNESNESDNEYERQIYVQPFNEVVIQGVPEYAQVNYPHPNNSGGICVATCISNVMGFWDRNSYWNLIDNGTAPLLDFFSDGNVAETVEWFRVRYYDIGPLTDATKENAVDEFCNTINELTFSVNNNGTGLFTSKQDLFEQTILEIDENRPVIWGVDDIQNLGGGHCLPIIGYRNGENTSLVRAYLNLGGTGEVAWVDWYGNDGNAIDCDDITTVNPGGTPSDHYEPDNYTTESSAKTIDPDGQYTFRQTHNFFESGDVDCIKFYAEAPRRYIIETTNLGVDCDTEIQLIGDDGNVCYTIDDDDDGGEGSASKIVWNCYDASDNPFYVVVREKFNRSGPHTNYDIEVSWENIVVPQTPIAISPADDEQIHTITPLFEWSAFQDGGDGETQVGYQFRVRCDTDGDEIVYETGFISSTSATQHTYSPGAYSGTDPVTGVERISLPLEWGKHYHWHVRYRDSGGDWSTWSAGDSNSHQDFYTTEPLPDIEVNPLFIEIYEPSVSSVSKSAEINALNNRNNNSTSDSNTYSKGLVIPEEVKEYWETNSPKLNYSVSELKSSVDWSINDSPVKNQNPCGSCWAFAAIGLIENLGNQSDLSEQEIVSCAPGDCGGGWYWDALEYVRDNGVSSENCYSYLAENGDCNDKCETPDFLEKITDFTSAWGLWGEPATVNNIKNQLQNGPLCVAMRVPDSFHRYDGGIFNYEGGEIPWNDNAHAVLVVGYDDEQQYFLVKNSWGQDWGEDGYFRIAYDDVTDDVQFGSYAVNGSGVYTEYTNSSSFTIQNVGDGTLNVSEISSDKSWLSVEGYSLPITLSSGSIHELMITIDWNLVGNSAQIGNIGIQSDDPDEQIVNVEIIAIPQGAPPVADFSPTSKQINVDNSIRYSDLSLNEPTSWNWSFEGGTPGTSTLQNPTVIYNSVGEFDVSLTVSNADGSDTKTVNNAILVEDNVVPENYQLSSTTLTTGTTDCFNATSTITVAGDGTNVVVESGASAEFIAGQNIRFLPGFHAEEGSYTHGYITTTGDYCVEAAPAIVAQEEQVTEKEAVIGDAGLTEHAEPEMFVYPNPNRGQFTVEFRNFEGEIRVMLFNSIGQMVQEELTTDREIRMNVPNLKSGMYFIKAVNKGEQFNRKIVVK